MRSAAGFSATGSCLTVEATWDEAEAEAATGGDGAAVTAVLAPGSVFTVAAEDNRSSILHMNYKFTFGAKLCSILVQKPPNRKIEAGSEGGQGWKEGRWWWGQQTLLTLCQRQGKGVSRLVGRALGGSSSSCSRGR